tara:strand:+ start:848 stop:1771 length:924 start_codon:yes stop_codon:yes gene_type:complete
MVTRHTYASIDDLRDYLAGTTYSSGWTSDAVILRRILETASLRIDDYVGMQSFGARTDTKYFDIGTGSSRDTVQLYEYAGNNTDIGVGDRLVQSIPLGAWLVSPSTVTSYSGTDRTTSETLTEGYNNDFFLTPYNSTPKIELKMNEDTAKALNAGQQTLSIAGTWGYSNDTTGALTTTGAITSTTVVSWGVNDATDLEVATTILVDSEQMYITGISSNTLTVERGVNGTTAATHSAGASVYTYIYPSDVVQACLDLGRIFFRDRDAGVTPTLGTGEQEVTKSNVDAKSVLKTLDGYRNTTTQSGVFF